MTSFCLDIVKLLAGTVLIDKTHTSYKQLCVCATQCSVSKFIVQAFVTFFAYA